MFTGPLKIGMLKFFFTIFDFFLKKISYDKTIIELTSSRDSNVINFCFVFFSGGGSTSNSSNTTKLRKMSNLPWS